MWILAAAVMFAQPASAVDPFDRDKWRSAMDAGTRCADHTLSCPAADGDYRLAKADVVRLQTAAQQGDVLAMRAFGLLLWQGQQVRRDREAALGWFYEAALRNDAASMYMLGVAFERGDGVGRDLKLADYWTNRAIQYGYKIPESR